MTDRKPCYVLVDQDGREVDADGQHFRTASDAKDWWTENGTSPDMPGLKQLDKPCHVIACVDCGYVFDEEEHIYHFESPADALSVAQGEGWKVDGGQAWCQSDSCLTDAERAEMQEATR